MTPPASESRKPVLFTFGNHMHWVDMQWLWGYHVLPGSVRDMLHLCREAGVKGNVNFDGVGYEKMAAECPETLAELREAIANGTIEPVGCSYGQPYGLFHGGESNIRQFTYGVRATRRLLGVRPRAFWEEEFYFFPQLPQILASCGYTSANLFFQWTWHTPEIPRERCALIQWEGIDGTRILALPRNDLNLHQWPEDFALLSPSPEAQRVGEGRGGGALINDLPLPAIVQWLELMPSKDWMCRSEVLLPKLKELLAHPDYAITPCTMSEMVERLLPSPSGSGAGGEGLPIRAYAMDDVWHGMTLGKNADRHPRTSRRVEETILAAESISAIASLFGRPYASWDVYPSWELDEAWRELLAAQHHDNHECEGLCGFIGYHQMEKAQSLALHIWTRTSTLIGSRLAGRAPAACLFNPLLWPVERRIGSALRNERLTVPPCGYARLAAPPDDDVAFETTHELTEDTLILSRADIEVAIDRATGTIRQITSPAFPSGLIPEDGVPRLLDLRMTVNGETESFDEAEVTLSAFGGEEGDPAAIIRRRTVEGLELELRISLHPLQPFVRVEIEETESFNLLPDGGLNAALRVFLPAPVRPFAIEADAPLSAQRINPHGSFRRKYPEGDWMTSPQWFETIERPFTAHRFVSLSDPVRRSSLLYLHDGAQQFLTAEGGVWQILSAYDPWDESHYTGLDRAVLWIGAAGPMPSSTRVRLAETFRAEMDGLGNSEIETIDEADREEERDDRVPPVFGALDVCNAPNVIAHAFFRANEKDGEHFPDWAGHRMHEESNGACTHPFVIRLVEWDGEPATVTLKFPGEIATAAKTNLMGEVLPSPAGRGAGGEGSARTDARWLTPEPSTPPDWARESDIPWSQVTFTMRPREIATIMADLAMGRKQFRDLDAKRDVWATVHRAAEHETSEER